ncbi:MAG TPA: divergent polysaccharide deacetylase family protein [Syntrophales bacterium]|nr:divergent polysaccharide deacetylase family protein [Syntrophales bacterium]
MDRRSFLLKGASLLGGYLLGFNSFSQVFALEKQTTDSSLIPSIALIIDDIGGSVSRARHFLKLDIPITFSILPRLKYSNVLALEINDYGHETMLHQPMEPYDQRIDPGPGALYTGDDPNKITEIIEENISELPLARGINNHMGSRFTESQEEMTETLRIIKNRGFFFVDSRTSMHSQAYKIAKTMQMPAAYRHIFLDNVPFEPAILFQLRKLKQCAMQHGNAIGIGHPFPQTANALRFFTEELKKTEVAFVHISKVLSN